MSKDKFSDFAWSAESFFAKAPESVRKGAETFTSFTRAASAAGAAFAREAAEATWGATASYTEAVRAVVAAKTPAEAVEAHGKLIAGSFAEAAALTSRMAKAAAKAYEDAAAPLKTEAAKA